MTDLSRLLDGTLPPEEEAALRDRIARDPELARRWAVMRSLPDRLASLPLERAGAPPLVARGADRPAADRLPTGAGPSPTGPAPRPGARLGGVGLGGAAGWLVAATLGVALIRPAPERVLLEGAERVDGRAHILAGDVAVEIDGMARVAVEPPRDGRREVGAEADMTRSHLLAALAGSIVTVTVYEGSARVFPPDGPAREVPAGQTVVVGAPTRVVPAPRPADRPTDHSSERVAALQAEIDRLEAEKAEATGQLVRAQGAPVPWPAQVPPAFRRDDFARTLSAALAETPEVEVLALDCAEYPCVALLESHAAGPGWEDDLRDLSEAFGEGVGGFGMAHERATPDGELRLYGFAALPPDLGEEGTQRARHRLEALVEAEAGGM